MQLKKTLIIFLSLAVFAGGTFAQQKNMQLETLKQERIQFIETINSLVNKYNIASDIERPAIREQITAVVSDQTDKDIVNRRKLLSEQKERIAKFEAQLNEMEKDKAAYVKKKVDFILSAEGQKRVNEFSYKVVVVTTMTSNGIQRQIMEFTSGSF